MKDHFSICDHINNTLESLTDPPLHHRVVADRVVAHELGLEEFQSLIILDEKHLFGFCAGRIRLILTWPFYFGEEGFLGEFLLVQVHPIDAESELVTIRTSE